jgi:hypothetical protein
MLFGAFWAAPDTIEKAPALNQRMVLPSCLPSIHASELGSLMAALLAEMPKRNNQVSIPSNLLLHIIHYAVAFSSLLRRDPVSLNKQLASSIYTDSIDGDGYMTRTTLTT